MAKGEEEIQGVFPLGTSLLVFCAATGREKDIEWERERERGDVREREIIGSPYFLVLRPY